MRKVLYISGTRADYGLMGPVLEAIRKTSGMDLEIIATGMHLLPEFGNTIEEIRAGPFRISEINSVYADDSRRSAALFIGDFIRDLAACMSRIKPDVILLLGDRAEMLGGAIVGTYMGIPVAHIHGGDVSSTIDEHSRHAITKLAHIHFPATKKSADRILKMGEEPWRVHVVGSPALDDILARRYPGAPELEKKYGIDASRPLILAVQHPVSEEHVSAGDQMRETLEALVEADEQSILIYPNADAGGRAMIREIRRFEGCGRLKAFKNIPRCDYLGLMRIASVIVGNSSSGIIEAQSLGVPAVNIGTRQSGREKSGSTIDTGYSRREIIAGIRAVLEDDRFRSAAKQCNPYGDGHAGERIAGILSRIEIDGRLLQKRLAYEG